MKKISLSKSTELVEAFLIKLKKDVSRSKKSIEFFELTLHEPIYEKMNCAYIQTNDLKSAILYDGVTNKYFYLRTGKDNIPVLESLANSVDSRFPKAIKDKMFWVCGNKIDKALELADLGDGFSLVKPSKI